MKKLFLLDAYALIFRSYYAFIRNPLINSKGFNTSAIHGFVNTLYEILMKEQPDYIGVAFDPAGPTFRNNEFEAYKAQREATPEVIKASVPLIKEIITAFRIPILEVEGFEADDVIGTLSHQASHMGVETYMMTPDKDYGQLVQDHVYIYRPKYGSNEYEVMGQAQVVQKYGVQTPLQIIDLLGLMGDAADNIPGCPGVGPKTAQKLLQTYGSVENVLAHADELKGSLKQKIKENAEAITFSKYLATIRLDVPIQLDLKQLEREEPDTEALKKIFTDLEFRTLTQRIVGAALPEPAVKNEARQSSLFDEIAEAEPEVTQKSKFDDIKTLPHSYYLVEDEKGRADLIQKLLTTGAFCLDTETTGLEPMVAELVGMSFSIRPHEAWYVPVPSGREEATALVQEFSELFENEKILKIGQNIKYDLLVIENYGVTLRGPLFDTMLAHYVLQPELPHNMDYMSEVYLRYQPVPIESLIGKRGKKQNSMRDLSPADVYAYAAEDADVTWQLYEVLAPRLKEENMDRLFYEIEVPLLRVLERMERNGVRIDAKALAEISESYTRRMQQIETAIYTEVGEEFNISSPKQVGEILFERLKVVDKPKKTKTGQYVTSEEVLTGIKSKHPVIAQILAYRGLKKLISTYVDALPKLVNPITNRIHTSFNQAVTATGRLSSSNPNLQNIPIRDDDGREIRKAFIPDAGCRFFSADYSQIELRLMAHLSGDEHMIAAFRAGEDIHAATAAKIYHVPLAEVTREQRSKAKTANFGIIYGISVFGLSERLSIPRGEAKELIDGYFEAFPGVKKYMDEAVEKARRDGYVETLFGRRRYLPDIHSRNAVVRGYAERNAINAPIQGTAADIIKIAMVNIQKRFDEAGLHAKMILQVHDELNFSVPQSECEQVERIVLHEMEQAYRLDVPLHADSGWGDNWLEAH